MRMDRRAGLLASGAVEITYSGSFTDELVTMDGSSYRLLTLTSSGTLAASKPITGDIWICGGGGCGGQMTNANPSTGGGGGYAASLSNSGFQSLSVIIGAGGTGGEAGGNSSVSGDVSLSANGAYGGNGANWQNYGNGGSGGGGDYNSHIGQGDGLAKRPFASAYFAYPYCDGGGGGGYYVSRSANRRNGGTGGTNGSNGSAATSGGYNGGAGGGHYGGTGGNGTSSGKNGSAGTGYGAGGGGAGYYSSVGSGGEGYQGVCFIRIPAPGATPDPDPGPQPLSDLTGTTWYFNDTLSIASADYATYSINFTYNTYSNATSLQINGGYGNGAMLYDSTNVYYGSPSTGYWSDSNNRTISITGGTDATNATLIAWLQANATQVT